MSHGSLFFALSLLCAGCTTQDHDWNVDTNHGRPAITWQEFRSSVYQEPWEGGAYVVDGDIRLFGERELREFYERWVDQEAGQLTVYHVLGADVLWPDPQRFQLTYCISNNFGARKPEIVTAIQQATTSWSDVVAVQFEYRPDQDANCTNANGNVIFNARLVPASFFAAAFFPDAPRSGRELLVTEAAFTTSSGGRDLQGIMRHEIGHTLGFRHEHIHIACNAEGPSESRQVTSYDVNSVMHYPQCRPSGTGGYRQTALDFEGAIALYGARQLPQPADPFPVWMVPAIDLILE